MIAKCHWCSAFDSSILGGKKAIALENCERNLPRVFMLRALGFCLDLIKVFTPNGKSIKKPLLPMVR